jgi:hypothetical protein
VYVFRIVAGDDLACSGTMTLGKRNDILEP